MTANGTQRRVLVIGGGGAGLSAALEARKAGAEVMLVDTAQQVGGATALSGGIVYAADTDVQKQAGVSDTKEELFAYYMTISHYRLEPRLIRTLVEGSQEVVGWLKGYGVTFDPKGLYIAGLETRPRGHKPTGETGGLGPAGGAVIVNALLKAAKAAGVTIRENTRIVALSQTTSGIDARTEGGESISAGAVVLATGGFGASPEMLARFYPDATKHGEWHWYMGPPDNKGDGITMGLSLGGVVVNQNAGCLVETPNFQKVIDAFTPPWLVFVNLQGKRFINEMASYCVLGSAIASQPGSRCYAIFDNAALSIATEDPKFTDPYGLGVALASNWTSDILQKQIRDRRIIQAASLEDLASALKVPVENLKQTVQLWNDDVSQGQDSTFEKPPIMMLPISQPPYFAVDMRPAIIGMTFTGLQIDQNAKLLDGTGKPIPNVYAAGELAAGVEDRIYPAGGTSVATALVFGRIAGINAAKKG